MGVPVSNGFKDEHPHLHRHPPAFYKASFKCFRARILTNSYKLNFLIIIISIVIVVICTCSWFFAVVRRRRHRKQTCKGSYVRVISVLYSSSTSTCSWEKLKRRHQLPPRFTFPITIWLDLDCSFLDFIVGAGNSLPLFCCLVADSLILVV
ncbi:hypothetical protein L1887_36280 [Cichorium endivia]|nr:hypothetical protein L1887_36280 [Cichorium endivia]